MITLDWRPADFRAWLMIHAPDAIVGITDSVDSCPLVTWRAAQHELVSVTPEHVLVFATGVEYDTPAWVELFVHEIDARHATDDYKQEPVTAAECLLVLDQLPEGVLHAILSVDA